MNFLADSGGIRLKATTFKVGRSVRLSITKSLLGRKIGTLSLAGSAKYELALRVPKKTRTGSKSTKPVLLADSGGTKVTLFPKRPMRVEVTGIPNKISHVGVRFGYCSRVKATGSTCKKTGISAGLSARNGTAKTVKNSFRVCS